MSAYLPYRRDPLSEAWRLLHAPCQWAPAISIAALAAVIWLTLAPAGSGAGDSRLQMIAAGDPQPALEARSISTNRRYDFVTVSGDVANLTPQTIRNVEAVVEFRDASARLLKVETALLETPDLAPASASAFVVHTRAARGMAAYQVRFRSILGATIPSRTY